MVCKEELFLWFKSLKGSKRLDILCGLLNMCCPLELRYCATCVEELVSRDFYSLKDEESKANNPIEVSKVKNILDPHMRSKLIVTLSLLHSSNVLCSNAMFKVFAEEMKLESLISAGVFSDAKCVDEILLLLTLAQNHPAFTFDQQTFLMELFVAVESCAQQTVNEEESRATLNNLMPAVNLISPVLIPDPHLCNNTAVCYHHDECQAHSMQRGAENPVNHSTITSLKVKAPHKKMSFRIRVVCGTSKVYDIFKTPYEIAVFHQKLVQLFLHESPLSNHEKYIPQISHLIASSGKQEVLTESLTASLTEYIERLNCHLPSQIMEHEFVVGFFSLPGHGPRAKAGRSSEMLVESRKNQSLPSMTIYNSRISEHPPTKHLEGRPRMTAQSPTTLQHMKKGLENGTIDASVPVQNTVLMSPVTSPYASPPNSETNSRSASPWVQRIVAGPNSSLLLSDGYALERMLAKEHLHDYWEILRNHKLEELQTMSQEELECLGIMKDASSKIKKILDSLRTYMPNGINVCRNQPVPPVPSNCLPIQDMSNESSPVGSDCSSPSQSPSPTEICNHNSSSSEEASGDNGPSFSDHKPAEGLEHGYHDPLSKRLNENSAFPKGHRDVNGRLPLSNVIPFPVGYTAVQLSPMQAPKPSFLQVQCRTNPGIHIGHSGMVFEGQFSRVQLPSALTFPPHMSMQRSHSGTPERGLSSTPGLPITTLCPFPLTSSCSTAPSATSNKSGNITVVTNSVAPSVGNARQLHKVVQPLIDATEILPKPPLHQQTVDSIYAPNCGYLFSTGEVSTRASVSNCSCISTATFAGRPSQAQSPSAASTTPQQGAVPVTLPYIGPPYVFPHSFPFIQTHSGSSANGFMQPATAAGHGFTYALPNGISAITPEMYGAHAFTLQSPSQATPPLIASPVSQCYGSYPQPVTVAGMTATHALKVATCYNCGKIGHRGPECKEQNIEEISKPGKFQMNFAAIVKPVDNSE